MGFVMAHANDHVIDPHAPTVILDRLQDAGNGVNIQDIPFRLIPCLVAGLAFYIAQKKPEVAPERVLFLKSEYEQQWLLASQEDREKAPDRFVPRTLFYS